MQTQISSDSLKIRINHKGAELASVTNKNNVEYIWQADPQIWPRHAPVLFPIVGKLKDNCFLYKDKFYELPQHGFARDLEFELTAEDKNSCVFQLKSTPETKFKYPFDFVFEISYELKHDTLITHYTIQNTGEETMLASVGAHPGFRCPLEDGETFEDYSLEFEENSYSQTLLKDGLLSDDKQELNLTDQKLPLSVSLFDRDALVFENSQISKIVLCSKKSLHKIIMECHDWPYFGIWSKKGCNQFVCLEPWQGIADGYNSSQQFKDKKGLIAVDPGRYFTCSFSITFE
jgi:galactose mutarotase-like enzyme